VAAGRNRKKSQAAKKIRISESRKKKSRRRIFLGPLFPPAVCTCLPEMQEGHFCGDDPCKVKP
jgi:hypothetical protein